MQFASEELVEMAASCLDEITAEMKRDELKDSSAASSSLSLEIGKEEKDGTSQHVTSGSVEASTKDQTPCHQSTSSSAAALKSESIKEETTPQQQDAVASKEKTSAEGSCDLAHDLPKVWVDRVITAGHILCPQSTTLSLSPTLLTGLKLGELGG